MLYKVVRTFESVDALKQYFPVVLFISELYDELCLWIKSVTASSVAI